MSCQIYNVGYRSVNSYLLVSSSHTLLFDAGFPEGLRELGRQLRVAGKRVKDIDYVLVSHFHIDHAGGVQEIKNEGAKLLLPEIQEGAIEAMEQLASRKWNYTALSTENTLRMQLDGSRLLLSTLGFSGEVVHTPGHTDDSISLLLDTGEVFTGDLPREDLIDGPAAPAKQSWELLKAKGAMVVYPGHGASYHL